MTSIPDPLSESAPAAAGVTILVVDDELAIRGVVGRLFTRLGYETVAADGGAAALAALDGREWKVDLVLTDVEMPGMSGLELGRRIRLRDPSLPILYMSGYMDGRTRGEAADDAAGRNILMKPFDFAVLLDRVRRALRERGTR